MFRKFLGPVALLLALIVGDQIRIHRPDHKYRLTIAVDTPQGAKEASGVFAVHPDRGYTQGGTTKTRGDAIVLDVEGKPLLVLLAHGGDGFDLDGINYVAVRAFAAAGQRAAFKSMDRVKGSAPVTGPLIPLLATFTDPSDPSTMKAVAPDDLAAAFGTGVRLRGISVAIVPNGYWPLDVGGAMGEPVTRGIEKVLPWVATASGPAVALAAAGWTPKPGDDPRLAFTRS